METLLDKIVAQLWSLTLNEVDTVLLKFFVTLVKLIYTSVLSGT